MKKGYSFMDLGENPTYTVEQIGCQDALRINGAGNQWCRVQHAALWRSFMLQRYGMRLDSWFLNDFLV